jgi:hypothetical protein
MKYFVYVSNAGIPETGLVAGSDIVWESLVTAENGTDKSGSAPSITELGGGWYMFEIIFGTAPWDVLTEDLVGVIDCDTDGDAGLANADRYKPIAITKRGLGLALLGHKGVRAVTGDLTIYAADDATEEVVFDMTTTAGVETRAITAP